MPDLFNGRAAPKEPVVTTVVSETPETNSNETKRATFSWANIWIPVLLAFSMYRAAANPDLFASRNQIGHYVSGPFYQAYVVFGVGLLLAPFALLDGIWIGWWALDLVLGNTLISQIMKATIHLPRPTGRPHGFPSGHTMFAVALAVLLYRRYPRWAPLWFALAAAIGWSRVDINAHYPYQVFFGAIFGLALGFFVTRQPRGVFFHRFARRQADPNVV
jgi:membrane-associated phospholipid phosphatase